MREWMILSEQLFRQVGYWITDAGETIECDDENDRHHCDIAAQYFGQSEDDDEGFDEDGDWDDLGDMDDHPEIDMDHSAEMIVAAMEAGWVRICDYGQSVGIEWRIKLSSRAKRALIQFLSGTSYTTFGLSGPESGARVSTEREAIRFIQEHA